MEVVREVIVSAIQQGAPAYNQGKPDECYRIYRIAASTVLEAAKPPEPVSQALQDALARSAQQVDPNAQAWTMRRAFDSILDGSVVLRAAASAQVAAGATDFPVLDCSQGLPSGLGWSIMDDVIMGGVSSSNISYDASTSALIFAGNVTTDSNGGFASVRSRPWAGWQALAPAKGVRMLVQGDGRVYKLSFKTDDTYDGVQYQHDFPTKAPASASDFEVVDLPFAAFTPNFRGRPVSGQPPLQGSSIRQLGLMVSKFAAGGGTTPGFRNGAFRLAVRHIRGFI